MMNSLDKGCKLIHNIVHNIFTKQTGRLLNILNPFDLFRVSKGEGFKILLFFFYNKYLRI